MKIINHLIYTLASTLLLWIVITMVFFSDVMIYQHKKEFLLSNWQMANMTIVLITGFGILYKAFLNREFKIPYDRIVKIATVILFFVTGWDAGGAVVPAAKTLLIDDHSFLQSDYFSFHPNNHLIISIFAMILKVNKLFGVFTGDHEVMSIVVVNCLIVAFSCYLIYRTGLKIFRRKSIAFFTYCISLLILGISPWSVIPYSDSLALFLPILIFSIYIDDQIANGFKIFCVLILSYVGYLIKPQVIIVLIAIIISESVQLFTKKSTFSWQGLIGWGIISLLAILLLNIGLDRLHHQQGFVFHEEQAFSMTHYFMIGQNEKENGTYSQADFEFTKSIKK